MRKVAFALAHCFQTCLISLACCSTCLVICFLIKIALKNLSNRSKQSFITAKLLAVCKLVCTFAWHPFDLARNHFCLARNYFCFAQNCFRQYDLVRISRDLQNSFARNHISGVEFRASSKHSRASWKTISRGLELLRAACKSFSREILRQHYHFWSILAVCIPNAVLFGIRYCSLSANSLEQTTLCFAEILSSHFNRVSSYQLSFVFAS